MRPESAGPQKRNARDTVFRAALRFSAILVLLVICGMLVSLVLSCIPSLKAFGLSFFIRKSWNPISNQFGALPFLVGTLLTSFLALIIAIPFSLSISVCLGEYLTGGFVASVLRTVIDLLSGIPSIIYGFWGLFVLVPIVRWLETKVGALPYGVGIFAAALLLSIMILPFSASLGSEILRLVPSDIKEGAYSLGATRFEVIKAIIFPYAYSGIFAGILLALGRALGETMAVMMVIGNSNFLPNSIFAPGNTMASVIANQFAEATGTLHLSSLIEIGLALFAVTALINAVGQYIVKRMSVAQA